MIEGKTLTNSISVREIDNLFINLDDTNLKVELRRTHDYNPIEFVTTLHFLLTQINNRKDLDLITNIPESSFENLSKSIYDNYILVCCILYDPNLKLRGLSGNSILTLDIFHDFISKLKTQEDLFISEPTNKVAKNLKSRFFSPANKSKNDEGFSFLIPVFDHLESEGLHSSAYLQNRIRSKGPRDIEVWFERLFRFNDVEISQTQIYYDLSIVINELMQNTNDWARTTFDDESYIRPNLRACSINIFLKNKLNHENSSYDHIHFYIKEILEAKLEDLHLPNRQTKFDFTNEKVGICEISILDTGPGMARRWLKKDYKDISHEDEVKAVIECFHKYFTSDNSSRTRLRGRGLTNVIEIIGLTGLIRVRTGRSMLLRNCFHNKVQQGELTNGKIEFDIRDSNMPYINGTSISVLYPFVYTTNANDL